MLAIASARLRALMVVLVLSVVAGGGWLGKVSADDGGPAVRPVGSTGRMPAPAAVQKPMTPAERRAQTTVRGEGAKSHGLPTTKSRPATARQMALFERNQRAAKPGAHGQRASRSAARAKADAAAPSYSSGSLYQYTVDPFGNTAAQQGGWLMALGNHIGAAVPGEPLQVSAAIWQTGGADDEVHPVKVRWKVEDYCAGTPDKVLDFGQTVQAPTLNTGRTFPVVNASITLPTTVCDTSSPSYFVYVCTTVADDPTDNESCGSYNLFYMVPALPEGAACAALCGDASGSAGTTVMRADPVNTATGAFTESFTDARVPAPGVPLTVGRVYSSDNADTGALGKGWQLPWETRLSVRSDGDVVLIGEGGARHTYTKKSGGAYATPGQARSTLSADGSGYRLTTADHRVYSFTSEGRLSALKDRTARGLTLEYTGARPTKITDAAGRAATLSYSGDRLDRLTLADGRLIDYDYTGGRLTAVKALDGATEKYGYDSGGFLDEVTGADGKVVTRNVYDDKGRVTSQTDGAQQETRFAYRGNGEFDQADMTAPDGGVWTDIYYKNVLFTQLDPLGNKSYYRYDQHFNRTSAVDAEVRETQWDFDTTGRLKRRSSGASDETWSYDKAGNVESHTDGESNKTVFGYNAKNQLTSVDGPLTKPVTYGYDATTGLVETATSALGKTTRFGHDDDGNLTSVTRPEGGRSTFTYDASGRLKTAVDPRGNETGADPAKYTTAYTYDTADRLKTVTDARGNVTAYDYDPAGRLFTRTDAAKRVTTYAYDDAGRPTEVTDPVGKKRIIGYDKAGRVASVTDRTGGTTSYQYDKAGRQSRMVTARGNTEGAQQADHTWKFGYDKVGNRTSVTDPQGRTSAFTWDADDRPLSTTDPLGHTRSVKYDDNGSVTNTVDGLGHGTTLAYDDEGRLESSKTWSNHVTRYEYDDDGNLTAEVSPAKERTTYTYDGDSRLATSVDPRGNATGADPAEYTWTYGYDAAGHATTVTDPLGHKATAEHDAVGNVTAVAEPGNKPTVYAYDALNRVDLVTHPDGGTTDPAYGKAGFLETSKDANSHVTKYGYDAEGRMTSVTNPRGETVGYTYDAEGNRTTVTNARRQTITTTVDARLLPTKVTYSDGTPTQSYTYDDAGRPLTVKDATGTRTLTYDNDDKVETITSPGVAKPFTYRWNTDDTLKSRTYPDGRAISYTYDDTGRVKTQRTDGKDTGYQYDEAGNLTSVTLPTTTARTESRSYDRVGRLASLTTPSGGNSFAYDDAGRIITDTPKGGKPSRYAYDSAGRMKRACTDTGTASCLPGAGGETYTYDKVGNLTSAKASGTTTTYEHDEADRLSSAKKGATTTGFGYDADGNQTKDGADTYTYDPLGRVKTAKVGSDAYAFLYDADGNRTVSQKNSKLARTSRWDINNPLPQLATDTDSAGALMADYRYDPDGTARSMDRTKGTFHFTQDRQNSISTVFDSAGKDNYRYAYGPWGESTGKATVSGGQTSIFGYTGQYKDQYLPDRLLLRARSYDTEQSRFTTQDPVPAALDNSSKSSYAYVNNDPSNLADPSGACPWCIGGAIGGVIGGGVYALTHQDDFDWGDFAGATAKGAVIGAGAGFLAPAGMGLATSLGLSGGRALAVAAVTDAAIGAGYTYAVNTVQCQPTSPSDLLIGAAGGGLAPLLGPAFRYGKGLFGKSGASADDLSQLSLQLPSNRGWAGQKIAPAALETHAPPSTWTPEGRLAEAESMVDDFALKNYTRKTGNRTYVGAVNTETGEIALASSGGRYPGASYCAEGNVCFALGGDASKVKFTNAKHVVKNGASKVTRNKKVCVNCQHDYDPPQFIDGVQHVKGGRWDRLR